MAMLEIETPQEHLERCWQARRFHCVMDQFISKLPADTGMPGLEDAMRTWKCLPTPNPRYMRDPPSIEAELTQMLKTDFKFEKLWDKYKERDEIARLMTHKPAGWYEKDPFDLVDTINENDWFCLSLMCWLIVYHLLEEDK